MELAVSLRPHDMTLVDLHGPQLIGDFCVADL